MIKIAKRVVIIGGRAFFRGSGRAVGFRRGERRRARLRRTAGGGFRVTVESEERAAEIREQLRIERERRERQETKQRELEAQRKQLRQEKLELKAKPKVIIGTKGTRRIIHPSGMFAGQRARGKFVTVVGEDLTIGKGEKAERIKAKKGELVGVTVFKPKPVPSEELVTFEKVKPKMELKTDVRKAFPAPTIIKERTPLEIAKGTGISERASFELERLFGKIRGKKVRLKGKEDFVSGAKVIGYGAAQVGLGVGAVGLGTLQFISAPIKTTKQIVTHPKEIGLEYGRRLRTEPLAIGGEALGFFLLGKAGGKILEKVRGRRAIDVPEIKPPKKITIPKTAKIKISKGKALVEYAPPKELGKITGIETIGEARPLARIGRKVFVEIKAVSKVRVKGIKKPVIVGARGEAIISLKKFRKFTSIETKLETAVLGEKVTKQFDIKSLAKKQKIGLMEDIPPFLKAGVHKGVVTFAMVKGQRLPVMFSGAFAKQIKVTPKGKIFFQAARIKAYKGQEISPLGAKLEFFEKPIIDEKTIFRITKPKIEVPDVSRGYELLLKRKGKPTLERQLGFQVSEVAKLSAEEAFAAFRKDFPAIKTTGRQVVSGAIVSEARLARPRMFVEEVVEPLAIKRFAPPKVRAVPKVTPRITALPKVAPTLAPTQLIKLAQVQRVAPIEAIKLKTIPTMRLQDLYKVGLIEQMRFGTQEVTRQATRQTQRFGQATSFTFPTITTIPRGFIIPPILIPPRGGAVKKGKVPKVFKGKIREFKPDILSIAFGLKGTPDLEAIYSGIGGGMRPIPLSISKPRKRRK